MSNLSTPVDSMDLIFPLTMRIEFGWEVSDFFSQSQLSLLYRAGLDLRAFAERCLPGMGKAWMLQKLAPLRVHLGGAPNALATWINRKPTSIVFPRWDVWLAADFDQSPAARLHIAHELAHVLDNRLTLRPLPATIFGGGPADRLIRDLGGSPRGLRFRNGVDSLPLALRWTVNGGYGNRSSAEYFAETFAWSIYDPSRLPSPALTEWIEKNLFSL